MSPSLSTRSRGFTVAHLLQNSYVWNTPSLSPTQRRELDAAARDPNGFIFRETHLRKGVKTILWRVVGAARPRDAKPLD